MKEATVFEHIAVIYTQVAGLMTVADADWQSKKEEAAAVGRGAPTIKATRGLQD